ncbi:hypothetical protein NQ317_010348 [Molorchus minor]|uniref:Uncharacterized protein n=1 Tax=Molorchus minor TaxID=1323400 RepID=A0ABQ9JSY3_9CUCU|nr:hypothetical protein NQ317_010348 [Molorchus minor]
MKIKFFHLFSLDSVCYRVGNYSLYKARQSLPAKLGEMCINLDYPLVFCFHVYHIQSTHHEQQRKSSSSRSTLANALMLLNTILELCSC